MPCLHDACEAAFGDQNNCRVDCSTSAASADTPSRELRSVIGSHRPAFVLVHGAWHDAGVWDSLRAALGREGARSLAVQLPSHDAAIDASGYARVIARASRELAPDGPVVVGHSMSGIALPLVPALTQVRRLVFLAALVPAPGRPMIDVQAAEDVLGDTRAVARD